MKSQKIRVDPDLLAARVAREYSARRRIAYAFLAPDLKIFHASHNFMEIAVESWGTLEGSPVGDFVWELIGAEQGLAEVLSGQSPDLVVERSNRIAPDGSTRYLDFRVIPLYERKPGRGLLLLVEDSTLQGQLEQRLVQDRNELRITQQNLAQANEELQHLNRLKSLFLSMAAHDLRSPLTAVIGFAELLRMSLPLDGPPEQQEYLDIMRTQLEELNHMITDFLDLDQIEQGTLVIRPIICDLVAQVKETGERMSVPAERQNLDLSLTLPDEPVMIMAEPARVRQILHNLLGNAVKYTPEGGRIGVSVRMEWPYGVIQVTDTGRGMRSSELAHLFDLYYRTEEARQSDVAGTGLGLYIVKTLVEGHEGTIDVTSHPGQGTAFTVRLPLAQDVPKSREA